MDEVKKDLKSSTEITPAGPLDCPEYVVVKKETNDEYSDLQHVEIKIEPTDYCHQETLNLVPLPLVKSEIKDELNNQTTYSIENSCDAEFEAVKYELEANSFLKKESNDVSEEGSVATSRKINTFNETTELLVPIDGGNSKDGENSCEEVPEDEKKIKHYFQCENERYRCTQCDFSTMSKPALKTHFRKIHLIIIEDTPKKKFKCEICDNLFDRKYNLTKHIDDVHLKIQNFECDQFDATQQYEVRTHHENIDSKTKKFKCGICDRLFERKFDLKKHVNAVHLKVKNFKCDQCDFRTTQQYRVVRHCEVVHLKLKKFKCSYCDFSASRKDSLKYHHEVIHLNFKAYKCNQCEYATSRKFHLEKHEVSMHKKKPRKKQ